MSYYPFPQYGGVAMRSYRLVLMGALAVGLLAGTAPAAVVSVDHGAGIGNYSDTGPLGGGMWNHKSAQPGFDVTVAGLVDSTGNLTGVTYRLINGDGAPLTVDSSMANGDPNTASLLNDYRIWTTDVTIDNLVPNSTYDLVLFGTRYDGSTVHNTTFTVGGTPTTTTAAPADMSGLTRRTCRTTAFRPTPAGKSPSARMGVSSPASNSMAHSRTPRRGTSGMR